MRFEDVGVFLEYYEKVRARTQRILDAIPEERWNWSPMEGKFTFADLVRHIAAIERYMYAENALGRPSRYNGCGRELADGNDAVRRFFDRRHQESVAIFEQLAPEDLVSKCTTPAGTPITVWKWLRLLPEHEIHHRGQMYAYLGMLGVEPPPIYGMTSEAVAAASAEPTAE